MKTKQPNHKCEYCRKDFFDKRKAARFCGFECYDNSRKIEYITCKMCGDDFKPRAAQRSDTGRQKFCSISCKKKFFDFMKADNPSKACERCGVEFSFPPSRLKFGNPRFCSQSCAGNMKKWQNERFTRIKTNSWKKIRASIIKRDGNKCMKCGKTKMLTVHHIVKWSISKDDSPSNLITLCRSCHYSIEWNGVSCPVPPTD